MPESPADRNDLTNRSAPPAPGEPKAPARPLPRTLTRLTGAQDPAWGLDDDDLREMAKFTEAGNVWGLAAHPIERPTPRTPPVGKLGPLNLDLRARNNLAHAVAREQLLSVEGRLAAGSGAELRARVVTAQSAARLGQAAARMMFPPGTSDEGPEITLFIWPYPIATRHGRVTVGEALAWLPAEQTIVAIGSDDPRRMGALLESAFQETLNERAAYSGWTLAVDLEQPAATGEVRLMDAEAREWPLWRDPLVGAGEIARGGAALRDSGLAVGAMPFGIAVDEEGHIPLLERADSAPEDGCVLIPRAALP